MGIQPSRVLIVEDSRVQGERLRALLEGAGFAATWLMTGEDALEEHGRDPYELVLSDIVLPGIDGYEVCRRIKAHTDDASVMLLTSLTDPLDVVHGLEAGADNFLRKPYEPEQLLSRVRTILYNRELRRKGRAQMGLELYFLERRFMITAERQQILDLLVSTFEDLVHANEALTARGRELEQARDELAAQLADNDRERRRLRAVLSAAPVAMAMVDRTGRITEASESTAVVMGRPLEEIVGRRPEDLSGFVRPDGTPVPAEERPFASALAGEEAEVGGAFDLLLERPDGARVPVIGRASPIRDERGEVAGAVGVLSDLGGLANHHPRTHLPTQPLFADRVGLALAQARAEGRCTAVVALRLLHVDRVRARLGLAGHEALLARIGERVRTTAERTGVAAWCSGVPSAGMVDETRLAVVLPGLEEAVQAAHAAQLIAEDVRAAGEDGIEVGLAVGLALDRAGEAPADLVYTSLVAAEHAAEGGGGFHVYEPGLNATIAEELELEDELRRAIAADALLVHYQPVLRVSDESPAGAEALVRWRHPRHGMLTAARFVPVAERSGLVAPLGWSVMRSACAQAAVWRRDLPGAEGFTISVNMSAGQLAEDDVAERVGRILGETGLPPDALVVEVTETAVIDAGAAAERLHALKTLGVGISIDDFGTGYSSLVRLRRFPVDEVKVDRSFVAGMTTEPDDATIVASIVRLGSALGIRVVAEGVEDADHLDRLRALRCGLAQGWHWSPALAADDLARWWSAQAAGAGVVRAARAALRGGPGREPADRDR